MRIFEGLHVGVDQDEVLAFWMDNLRRKALDLYSHIPFAWLKDEETLNWNLEHGLDEEGREAVKHLKNLEKFYAELEPIPGAADALKAMEDAGIHVTIITAPTITNPTCASDKLTWLEEHIGTGWGDKAIITGDKTKVMADFLIDDRPEITGYYEPVWQHIVFDQPYNRHVNAPRMKNWSEWEDVLTWTVRFNQMMEEA